MSHIYELLCRFLGFVFLLLCLNILGCGHHIKQPKQELIGDAHKVWSAYENYIEKHKDAIGPYRVQARLTCYYDRKIHRLKLIAWGNSSLPLRLDLIAGMGTTVAQIYEDNNSTIVYTPSEKDAIIYSSDDYFLFGMDKSIPFRLNEVFSLIFGQLCTVLGTVTSVPLHAMQDGSIVYLISGSTIGGQLTLSPDGLPIKWEDSNHEWSFGFSYSDGVDLPNILTLVSQEGAKIVLNIYSRERLKEAFTNQNLTLHLPQDVKLQYAKEL